MQKIDLEEKLVHEKINGTIERCFKDRREIMHFERLFQDRVKGAIGLSIIGICATTNGFVLHCADKKLERGMRIFLTHSQYGNTFRLTATEVIFRDTRDIKWKRELEKQIEEACFVSSKFGMTNRPTEMVLVFLSRSAWFSISEKEEGTSEGRQG